MLEYCMLEKGMLRLTGMERTIRAPLVSTAQSQAGQAAAP